MQGETSRTRAVARSQSCSNARNRCYSAMCNCLLWPLKAMVWVLTLGYYPEGWRRTAAWEWLHILALGALWVLTLGYFPKQWRRSPDKPGLLLRLLFCPIRYLTFGLFVMFMCPLLAVHEACSRYSDWEVLSVCCQPSVWEKNWTDVECCSGCKACDIDDS